jgi:predicted enzyme related to lactoylglutathione lyase
MQPIAIAGSCPLPDIRSFLARSHSRTRYAGGLNGFEEGDMGRPVVHWEMYAQDAGKTADFYKTVFDWDISPVPGMDYHMANTGGKGINGGFMKQEHPMPNNIIVYIDVDDLDAYGRKITSAGGRLILEKQEVPGMGTFSLFTDPDGRVNGIWKNA